ncbi:arginyl-tRNA synthetase family protein [Babesia caballi]|uniref:arginine--tRNA ligase n=1 Tax=Babesia caballi TaxID=5871 RepID=A0AAV4LY92_BABCB|nr:arginyl-tRNA synthetase family protein [Babesia caballi]
MARAMSLLVTLASLAAASVALAATENRGSGGVLNAMMPHLANSALSMLTGTAQQDLDTPHISLKVMPSKRIHLSPSEMNALLFSIKQEIHRKVGQGAGFGSRASQVNQLEEDLLEHRHENEMHLSAWALNQAPVYMPFRDNAGAVKKQHEPTLQLEVEKLKQKAAAANSAGKPPVMHSIVAQHVKDVIKNALHSCIGQQVIQEHLPSLSVVPANPKFGDFQWNDAIALYKAIGASLDVKSSKELAELVKGHISTPSFSAVNVSPQGFLTVTLSKEFVEGEIQNLCKNGVTVQQAPKGFRVAVDFSSPNIAKEMHVGHLRSTIIGESLCRILEFHGYEVLRINHLGDWGTHFGMLVEYMLEKHPDFLTNVPSISDFTQFYKEAKALTDADAEFKARSRKRVVMLQSGEEVSMKAWRLLCEISEREFAKIYKMLDIRIENCGESFYNDRIPHIVRELQEKNLVVESEGAQCFFTPVSEVPLMAIKSDGSYGYDSTDLACIKYRIQELRCKWLIYVTDIGQSDHFMKVFAAARMAGWSKLEDEEVRLDHLGFGMVQDASGNKFKTRSGDTVKLVTLLDEAVARATVELEARIKARLEEGDTEVDVNVPEVAKLLGYGAVKYFELRQTITNNYKFSFDHMLDPRGNTAIYLLYAYARICQIFHKAGVDPATLRPEALDLSHPAEVALAKSILRLPAVLNQIMADYLISKLADYLYTLSVDFSAFYKQCKVVGDPNEATRLLLCLATKTVMKRRLAVQGEVDLAQHEPRRALRGGLEVEAPAQPAHGAAAEAGHPRVLEQLHQRDQRRRLAAHAQERRDQQAHVALEARGPDAAQHVGHVLGELEGGLLELHVGGGGGPQEEPEVDVQDVALAGDEQVAVVPVLDLEQVAEQRVAGQRVDEVVHGAVELGAAARAELAQKVVLQSAPVGLADAVAAHAVLDEADDAAERVPVADDAVEHREAVAGGAQRAQAQVGNPELRRAGVVRAGVVRGQVAQRFRPHPHQGGERRGVGHHEERVQVDLQVVLAEDLDEEHLYLDDQGVLSHVVVHLVDVARLALGVQVEVKHVGGPGGRGEDAGGLGVQGTHGSGGDGIGLCLACCALAVFQALVKHVHVARLRDGGVDFANALAQRLQPSVGLHRRQLRRQVEQPAVHDDALQLLVQRHQPAGRAQHQIQERGRLPGDHRVPAAVDHAGEVVRHALAHQPFARGRRQQVPDPVAGVDRERLHELRGQQRNDAGVLGEQVARLGALHHVQLVGHHQVGQAVVEALVAQVVQQRIPVRPLDDRFDGVRHLDAVHVVLDCDQELQVDWEGHHRVHAVLPHSELRIVVNPDAVTPPPKQVRGVPQARRRRVGSAGPSVDVRDTHVIAVRLEEGGLYRGYVVSEQLHHQVDVARVEGRLGEQVEDSVHTAVNLHVVDQTPEAGPRERAPEDAALLPPLVEVLGHYLHHQPRVALNVAGALQQQQHQRDHPLYVLDIGQTAGQTGPLKVPGRHRARHDAAVDAKLHRRLAEQALTIQYPKHRVKATEYRGVVGALELGRPQDEQPLVQVAVHGGLEALQQRLAFIVGPELIHRVHDLDHLADVVCPEGAPLAKRRLERHVCREPVWSVPQNVCDEVGSCLQ